MQKIQFNSIFISSRFFIQETLAEKFAIFNDELRRSIISETLQNLNKTRHDWPTNMANS